VRTQPIQYINLYLHFPCKQLSQHSTDSQLTTADLLKRTHYTDRLGCTPDTSCTAHFHPTREAVQHGRESRQFDHVVNNQNVVITCHYTRPCCGKLHCCLISTIESTTFTIAPLTVSEHMCQYRTDRPILFHNTDVSEYW